MRPRARISGVKEKHEVSVQNSPTRCPFCHEECGPAEEHVVCTDCLARHHSACWESNASCANCSSTRVLRPAPPPVLTRERAAKILIDAGEIPLEVHGLLDAGSAVGVHGAGPTPEAARLFYAATIALVACVATLITVVDQVEIIAYRTPEVLRGAHVLAFFAAGLLPAAAALVGGLTRRVGLALATSAVFALALWAALLHDPFPGALVAGSVLATLATTAVAGSLTAFLYQRREDRESPADEGEDPSAPIEG